MTRGVCWYLVGSVVLVALIGVAGCSHYMLAEREPWRHEAELTCLNAGSVKETPARVRVSAISGPGMCGADYPLRISALGESAPLGYDDEAVRPPGAVPNASMPQRWPVIQSSALPPPPAATAPQAYPPSAPVYPQQPYAPPRVQASQPLTAPQAGQPLSINPPGISQPEEDEEDLGIPGGPPHPYYGAPERPLYPPPQAPRDAAQPPPLGPPDAPMVTAAAGSVEVKPAATLACPIVSALDQWISEAVQPAALKWFRQPVVEIKQISAYSCRGMNGNPNAHISEHAFGNALDVAEFDLADGHKVSVQYGWHGAPEEQGFLHDVQGAACQEFTTVLAPGANVYHYNHIHVDLMRRSSGRRICEPAAVPGDVVAERARARYAAQHYGDPGVTGTIPARAHRHVMGYSGEDDERLPAAIPGDD